MEHSGSGRRFLVGALACTAVISGCSSSEPQVADTGSSALHGETGTIPPQVGATGTWELLNSAEVTPDSITLRLAVMRLGCAGGVTGTVLDPQVHFEQERIVIRTDVEPLPPGAYNCQGNNSVPVTVDLHEAVGKRELVDAACLEGRAVTTARCTNNGVRWRP